MSKESKLLQYISIQLSYMYKEDMSTCERNITDKLIEEGYGHWFLGHGDESPIFTLLPTDC